MRWFVTDAQLAAMRMDAALVLRAQLKDEMHSVRAAHDAEIQRLREDRAMELARLADPHAPFLAHLLEQLALLRRDVLAERQRAEIAIDQCRVTHQQIGPVTMPPREDRAPRELGAAFGAAAEAELAAMGRTDL